MPVVQMVMKIQQRRSPLEKDSQCKIWDAQRLVYQDSNSNISVFCLEEHKELMA